MPMLLRESVMLQTAAHPAKLSLVFNTQLQHELKNIARNRELTHIVPPGATLDETRPVLSTDGGRSTEINGWNLEKKMLALREVRQQLEEPFFLYADWGNEPAKAEPRRGGFSLDRTMGYYSYFNKILPLHMGQTALLDLWDYIMDMSDLVPVRNRCRSLYLHVAVCIARRVEFIDGFTFGSERIHVGDAIAKRYQQLLMRSLTFCTQKLEKSRFVSEEHQQFAAHIYAILYIRVPYVSSAVLDAVMASTDELARKRPSSTIHTLAKAQACSSPRDCPRNWHDLHNEKSSSNSSAFKAAFDEYKELRSAAVGPLPRKRPSLECALEAAFQTGLKDCSGREHRFIESVPLFVSSSDKPLDQQLDENEIKNMMGPFLERIRHTDRENLLIVKFVACLLSDVRCWCSSLHDVVWHCVPGYFCLIRSVLAVCKRMCQRRGRKNDSMSPGRKPGVTAPISGEEMWQAYWTPTEQDCVFDALAEILRNPVLVTPFIQVVLEGTNILDPSNVNYSFGILQRMIDVAAGTRLITALLNGFKKSPKNANKRASRGKLPDKFVPDTFFCAMKKALESSHIQILLKVLTFLYSTIDLFPAAQRKRLVNDVLLRDNFFRFFLHWNDEIRKIYCYILVFQLTTANRLDLPCASDRILLSRSPYFESTSGNMSPSAPSFGYWSNLSEIAQSMLRIYSPSHLDAERKETIGAGGLKRLVTWDFTARMKRDRSAGGDAVFRESMEDEELSVDLSLVSKLDALFKMMADQLSPTTDVLNFPVELEVYVEKGISQYIVVLSEYYESAFQHPDVIPAAPLLDFTIMSTMFSDN